MKWPMVLMLVGCGCNQPEPIIPDEPRAIGTYMMAMSIETTMGDCTFVRNRVPHLFDFDDSGNLEPPIIGIECDTAYPLAIRCSGYGAKLNMSASGWNYDKESMLIMDAAGNGELVGPLFGCDMMGFRWSTVRKE